MTNKLSFQSRLYDDKVDIVDLKTGKNHGTTSKENASRFISRSKKDESGQGKGYRTKESKTKNKPTVQLVIDFIT